jgi:hypothetical protein
MIGEAEEKEGTTTNMKNAARRTLTLGLCLSTVISMSPVTAQAYTCNGTDGTISYSYEAEYVVQKGKNVELSVLASTTDGHELTYQWKEEKTDNDGFESLGNGTDASYLAQNITEDKRYYCTISCGNHDSVNAWESVYVADELTLDQSVECDHTADTYDPRYFVFTPSESGSYIFLSSGTAASGFCIYDSLTISEENRVSGYDSLYSEEYGNYGGKAIVVLLAGHTYAIKTYANSDVAGSYSVSVQNYVPTELSLSTDQRSYNVDDKNESTTMCVTAQTSDDDKFLNNVTYRWYVYDAIDFDYVLLKDEKGTSITVQNSSVNWDSLAYRCEATDQYGESAYCDFNLYNSTDWSATVDEYQRRVPYNTAATLKGAVWTWDNGKDLSGMSYQWYQLEYDSSYYNGDKFVAIPGAVSAEYNTETITSSNRYMCIITDENGISSYAHCSVYPKLMNVSVDKTYYEVDKNDSLSVPVKVEKLFDDVNVSYNWYQINTFPVTEDGHTYFSSSETYLGSQKDSSIYLENITKTQVLLCNVYASRGNDSSEASDYVNIYFVVDPGTGYSYSYTTSDDENVTGASQAGLGLYLGETGLTLTADQTEYTLSKDAEPATLRVKASTSNDDAFLKNVTYQWYEYDQIDSEYKAIDGATGTSYDVSFGSVKWRWTQFMCTATDQNGSTASQYFYVNKNWNDLDLYINWTGSASRRVTSGATETFEIQPKKRVKCDHEEDDYEEYVSLDASDVTIQWYEYGYDKEKDKYRYTLVSGETTLRFTTAPITEDKSYMCVVTDANGVTASQSFYVSPKLMDVSVDKTYYEIASGEDATVSVTAVQVYGDTSIQYEWNSVTFERYVDEDGEVSQNWNRTSLTGWSGKSSIQLSNVTEAQYLECTITATRTVNGAKSEDWVSVYFVVDPGTGYYSFYTTSEDTDVSGASEYGLGNVRNWWEDNAVDPSHEHTMTYTAAKEATAKETGNKEYWRCTICGKLFADEAGQTQTTLDEVTIPVKESVSIVKPTVTAPEEDTTAIKVEPSTTTTTNTDGSVTTTTIAEDGTQTKVTTSTEKNGSVKTVTKVENPDGSTTSSTLTKNVDGSTKESTVEKSADGKVTTTTVKTEVDGSATKKVNTTEINSAGKSVDSTVTTKTDSEGKVTEITEKSVIDNAASNTSATITVKKDGDGNVTSAAASVQTIVSGKKSTITASLLAQIAEAAGISLKGSFLKGSTLGTLSTVKNMVNSVDITVNVTDSEGNTKYKLIVNTADLVAGNVLHLYKYSTKTGVYKAVNSKKYTVDANGGISVSAADKATYKLVSDTEAKEATRQIKATYAAKKTAVTLKTGKTTNFALKKGADQSSIKSITYTSSDKKVATVSKKGKITAKAAGKATISAKITLKNGKSKTVKTKVTVK